MYILLLGSRSFAAQDVALRLLCLLPFLAVVTVETLFIMGTWITSGFQSFVLPFISFLLMVNPLELGECDSIVATRYFAAKMLESPWCVVDEPTESFQVRSALECAIQCRNMLACTDFNFYTISKSCHVFTQAISAGALINDCAHFQVTYIFKFEKYFTFLFTSLKLPLQC